MYIDSVRVNMCRSVTCVYMATVHASTCMICAKIASKSTAQRQVADCYISRDLRFATQHACTVYWYMHIHGLHEYSRLCQCSKRACHFDSLSSTKQVMDTCVVVIYASRTHNVCHAFAVQSMRGVYGKLIHTLMIYSCSSQ